MFSELMPLFPNTKGMIIMTVAKVDDLHLRVSFHPAADDAVDKPKITAFAIEGTPAELDQPGINFTPLIEASVTINQQIAAKAEQVKAEPPPPPPPAPKPPAVTKDKGVGMPGNKAAAKPRPAAPAPPPVAAVAPRTAAPIVPPADLRARLAALNAGGKP